MKSISGVAKKKQSNVDVVNVGDIGYKFRKEFDSGWFTGTVIQIRTLAKGGKVLRCVYDDGDSEDLSLIELQTLAILDPNVTKQKPAIGTSSSLKGGTSKTNQVAASTTKSKVTTQPISKSSRINTDIEGIKKTKSKNVAASSNDSVDDDDDDDDDYPFADLSCSDKSKKIAVSSDDSDDDDDDDYEDYDDDGCKDEDKNICNTKNVATARAKIKKKTPLIKKEIAKRVKKKSKRGDGKVKRCSFKGCTKFAQSGGVCWTHGAKRKRCSFEGCTNYVQKGGVCITHGAKVKRCSFEGCNNIAQNGGVCYTHGAKRKGCSFEGCTNGAVKGGVCVTHGAKKKQCSFEGCNKQAVKGGVCYTHGAKKKRKTCNHEGCTKQAQSGGVCWTHGAERKHCSFEGCTNGAVKGGVCWKHGAKVEKKLLCSFKGCTNQVINGGVCITHGATRKRCSFEGCPNGAVKGGVCITHGASQVRKRCRHEGCDNYALSGGVCITHGAKLIIKPYLCSFEGCTKKAKKAGVCTRHLNISSTLPSVKRYKRNQIKPSSASCHHQSSADAALIARRGSARSRINEMKPLPQNLQSPKRYAHKRKQVVKHGSKSKVVCNINPCMFRGCSEQANDSNNLCDLHMHTIINESNGLICYGAGEDDFFFDSDNKEMPPLPPDNQINDQIDGNQSVGGNSWSDVGSYNRRIYSTDPYSNNGYSDDDDYNDLVQRAIIESTTKSTSSQQTVPANICTPKNSHVQSTSSLSLPGITNLTNTCYIAAACQAIFSIPNFMAKLYIFYAVLADGNDNTNNTELPLTSALLRMAIEIGVLIDDRNLLTCHRSMAAADPARLKKQMVKLTKNFIGIEQHDSQEFLFALVDRLHEELLKEKDYQLQEGLLVSNIVLPTDDYFYCEVRECYECTTCGHFREYIESYRQFSVDMGEDSEAWTLERSLQQYFHPEMILCDANCENVLNEEKCTGKTVMKTRQLISSSKALIFHFKRYNTTQNEQSEFDHRKNEVNMFQFAFSYCHFLFFTSQIHNSLQNKIQLVQSLSMIPYAGANELCMEDKPYILTSQVQHHGNTPQQGHYTTLAKKEDDWYFFNDSVGTLVDYNDLSCNDEIQRECYMAVYYCDENVSPIVAPVSQEISHNPEITPASATIEVQDQVLQNPKAVKTEIQLLPESGMKDKSKKPVHLQQKRLSRQNALHLQQQLHHLQQQFHQQCHHFHYCNHGGGVIAAQRYANHHKKPTPSKIQ